MLKAAKKLAKEINWVFNQVEQVIPQLADYHLKAKDPKWLPLKKGSHTTMRDHILLSYAEKQQNAKLIADRDLLLTCALSFDIVSSVKHFDVDHFVRHEAAEVNCFYGQEA